MGAAKKADKTVWWGALERDTELVIGLVSTVGTESRKVGKVIEDYLKNLSYEVQQIHISTDVIPIVNAKSLFKKRASVFEPSGVSSQGV